jgi:hypothetical protein
MLRVRAASASCVLRHTAMSVDARWGWGQFHALNYREASEFMA